MPYSVGRKFWEYATHESKTTHFFNEAMASRLVTGVMINECKGVSEGLSSLDDGGSGNGTVAKAIKCLGHITINRVFLKFKFFF
jgi:hypothetical protein